MVSLVETMVLGVLRDGERHGYDIWKEWEERGFLRWVEATKVAMYKALARLEKDGCLVSWTEKEGGSPERRVYAVTEEGEERLRDMVYDLMSSREPLRFQIFPALCFSDCLPRGQTVEALEERLEYLASARKRLEEERKLLKGVVGDLEMELLDREIGCYRAEEGWTRRLVGRIRGKREKK
jgi:DNA-binding PadR family transcriptional regulator